MNYAFSSDNTCGIHPQILEAIRLSNHDYFPSYGYDSITHHAQELFRHHFGDNAKTYFTALGTAANILGLKHILRSHEGLVCSQVAHLNVDECGAPEIIGNFKILPIPHAQGKLDINQLSTHLNHVGAGNVHAVQYKCISLTQSTELGTVYTLDELKKIINWAHERKMYVHFDGTRLSNAAVTLNKSFKELTTDLGVDLLSFGGTKNGAMGAEAIVFLNPELGDQFHFTQKQGMQMMSKMRFIASQFNALLSHDLWKQNASHANQMAQRLANGIKDISSLKLAYPCEANGVFVNASATFIEKLQKKYSFYICDPQNGTMRWMTSFQTSEELIDQFLKDIHEAAN